MSSSINSQISGHFVNVKHLVHVFRHLCGNFAFEIFSPEALLSCCFESDVIEIDTQIFRQKLFLCQFLNTFKKKIPEVINNYKRSSNFLK